MTPTMVYASSLSFTVRPITSGCRRTRLFQNRSLRIDDVLAAWRVLLRPKDASERRSGADDLEEARADGCRTYCSRGARAGERELPEAAD